MLSLNDRSFDEQKPYTLKGFRTYYPLKRQERNLKRLLCFVKEDVEVTERKDLMSPNISSVWLEHRPTNGYKILLCLNYREFNPCKDESEIDQTSINEQLARFEEFAKQVEKASLECDNIYILGDHNIDTSRWNEKGYYLKLKIKNIEEYLTNPEHED